MSLFDEIWEEVAVNWTRADMPWWKREIMRHGVSLVDVRAVRNAKVTKAEFNEMTEPQLKEVARVRIWDAIQGDVLSELDGGPAMAVRLYACAVMENPSHAVKSMQKALRQLGGPTEGGFDGSFGSRTVQAVRDFAGKSARGLAPLVLEYGVRRSRYFGVIQIVFSAFFKPGNTLTKLQEAGLNAGKYLAKQQEISHVATQDVPTFTDLTARSNHDVGVLDSGPAPVRSGPDTPAPSGSGGSGPDRTGLGEPSLGPLGGVTDERD